MSLIEVTERVHALGNAWEQFKHVNDARLKEMEKKGVEDPLHREQLFRINDAMDNYKQRLDGIETAMYRPNLGETKGYSPEACEYKEVFSKYLRKGITSGIEAFEAKSLSVGTDADGGYLVSPTLSQKIAQTIFESSPMRQLASIETISTDSLDIIEDADESAAGWTTETGSVSETDTPQIGKNSISVFEMCALPKATQKLIDDSSIDVEAWLAGKIADKFGRLEATAFISGNGTSQPKGILSYTAGTDFGEIEQISSGSDGVITPDSLVELYFALKTDYASNASFLMNRASVQAVRLIKESTTNQYLWQPSLVQNKPDTLMGIPVLEANDMPVPATDSLSVAVGDFKRAYLIVDRLGIRILRDPFTSKPFVKFYATKRVGGEVVNTEAVKLLKLAA